MFIHSVYFWLRPDLSDLDLAEFKRGLASLTKIETVRWSFIGVPAPTDRPVIDRSYSNTLILTFDDKEEHDRYQDHEVHEKFRKECSTFWSKVLIYDSV